MKPSIFKLHTQVTMGEHPHVVFIAPLFASHFFLPACTKCSWGKNPQGLHMSAEPRLRVPSIKLHKVALYLASPFPCLR